MKTILGITLFCLVIGSSEGKSFNDDKGLSVSAKLIGMYKYEEGPCLDYVHYLVEVNIINNSNVTQNFMTFDCTTAENVVTDSKDIINWVNNCARNIITEVNLEPKQVLSLPVVLLTKKELNRNVKFGFIFLNRYNTASPSDFFLKINKCMETFEHVIWSQPIMIDDRYSTHFSIK
jgi:hypothetical protein